MFLCKFSSNRSHNGVQYRRTSNFSAARYIFRFAAKLPVGRESIQPKTLLCIGGTYSGCYEPSKREDFIACAHASSTSGVPR